MKKNNKIIIIVLLLFISIGFAYLSTVLNINGAVTFKENNWDIHFENINLISTDVGYSTLEIDSNDNTKINTAINFKEPSEIFEYTVDVVNGGGIDAVFDSITNNINSTIEDYITVEVKYFDGSTINQNDLLRMGQSKRIRVKVIYNLDIDELPSASTTAITTTINYVNVNLRNVSYNRKVWNYEFTGYEQTFIIPKTGTYKVETWGAQGGSVTHTIDYIGGYGGYSVGNISVNKNNVIYINVGGQGIGSIDDAAISYAGGYNGGGYADNYGDKLVSSGGGATHIALDSGLLNTFSTKTNRLIIVAGGGGGSAFQTDNDYGIGGSGGGYIGSNGTSSVSSEYYGSGGTQSSGGIGYKGGNNSNNGLFGQASQSCYNGNGGGGGYYGGGGGRWAFGAGGGSGYIGNTNLSEKIMYCYNCQSSENEEDESQIKTRSTTNVSETPTSNYAKIGNGYARITLIN